MTMKDHEFDVIIEISANSSPIKYEFDEEQSCLRVDRFLSTPMFYPCNYGFLPGTLADDGDHLDALVISTLDLMPGVVISCRLIGLMKMSDEAGYDPKLLFLPSRSISKSYNHINTYKDLAPELLKSIEHFFTHYKDLEDNKTTEFLGWHSIESALSEMNKE